MAAKKKTETVVEKKETVKADKKVKMLCSYFGAKGIFMKGGTYTVSGDLAELFLKNKEAVEC